MSLVVRRPRSSSFNSGIENVPNITAFRDLGILRPRSRVPNLSICFMTLPSELNKEDFRYNGRLGSVHRIFVTLTLNVSWFVHLARVETNRWNGRKWGSRATVFWWFCWLLVCFWQAMGGRERRERYNDIGKDKAQRQRERERARRVLVLVV
ncbi:hypothetical protein C8J56DRAFT_972472, partial [Mycena floridula]